MADSNSLVNERYREMFPLFMDALSSAVSFCLLKFLLKKDQIHAVNDYLKVLLRRKFLSLFPSFFPINLFYRVKIRQIAKNLNLTCVRGLEISF